MFKNLKLKYLLAISMMTVSLAPIAGLGIFSLKSVGDELLHQEVNKLEAVSSNKKSQLEKYFTVINSQVQFISEDKTTVEAMKGFALEFARLSSYTDDASGDYESGVLAYYRQEFAREYSNQNGTSIDTATLLPRSPASLTAQHLYISNNPHPLGSKSELVDAGDGSGYSRLHAEYHPLFKSYLEKFGYYDIFLVEPDEGRIVYSVFKELDYATSLKTGPYSDTNFARAFKKALTLSDPNGFAIEDFEKYLPSYDAGASFIASPIYDGRTLAGVLVFQMPVGRINEIMQLNIGMGESGESYLVGHDFLMRSQSRFVEENTIITQRVDSETVKLGIDGNTGSKITDDYRGISVLSAYSPLDLAGLDWVIISEIDESEAFAGLMGIQYGLMIIILISIAFIATLAFFLIRRIMGAVNSGLEVAQKISQGDFSTVIDIKSKDEMGQLLQALQVMQDNLKERIEADALVATENGRIKTALDSVGANVMLADIDMNIIYMNNAVTKMMKDAETKLREALPGFDADKLIGANIDSFHKNPSHQRALLADLKTPYQGTVEISGLTFMVIANPVFGDDGERIGTVVEWNNQTAELAVESEISEIVSAAAAGDFSERIAMEGKDGFFERLAAGVNEILQTSGVGLTDISRVIQGLAKGDLP
ncbi:MAG: HAMP domain-containing protein, partial [Gammaproteobacteria bacterium]|nr:HAMP domain-containing protein [Gammaproteobacteria bacterium]